MYLYFNQSPTLHQPVRWRHVRGHLLLVRDLWMDIDIYVDIFVLHADGYRYIILTSIPLYISLLVGGTSEVISYW